MRILDGEPTARVLRRAKEMGVITCLDTVWNDSTDPLKVLGSRKPGEMLKQLTR